MRIALFGGTGFIGKEVANQLRKSGNTFFEISRYANAGDSFKADIVDYNSLDRIHEKADVIVICSSSLPKASYSAEDVSAFMNVNVTGIHNVLRWARASGASRIIHCSTLSMVPPIGDRDENELIDLSSHYLYKISKAAGEHLVIGFCREYGLSYRVLRISSVYGPGMITGIIDLIANKARIGEKFVINDGSYSVDFIHVQDVAKVIVASTSTAVMNDIVNVASAQRIKLMELAQMIGDILGKKIEVDVKGSCNPVRIKYRNAKMKALMGSNPMPLKEGLRELLYLTS